MYSIVCHVGDQTGYTVSMAIGAMGQFMEDPGKSHWEAVKRILRNLRGTSNYGIVVGRRENNELKLQGHCDSIAMLIWEMWMIESQRLDTFLY